MTANREVMAKLAEIERNDNIRRIRAKLDEEFDDAEAMAFVAVLTAVLLECVISREMIAKETGYRARKGWSVIDHMGELLTVFEKTLGRVEGKVEELADQVTTRVGEAWLDLEFVDGTSDDIISQLAEFEGRAGELRRVIVAFATAVVIGCNLNVGES